MFRIRYNRATTGVLQRYTKCSRERYRLGSPTLRREVMESKSGRPRTKACTFLSKDVTGLLHCFTERLTCSRGLPPCYDHDIIFFIPSVKVKVAVNTIVPRSPFFLFLYLKTQTVTHIRKNAVEYLRQWNGAICVIYNLCQRQKIRRHPWRKRRFAHETR